MKPPKELEKEIERLKELASYSILDTLTEDDYDNLTKIASEICKTPISLISFLDEKRIWFKSHHGLDVNETQKEYAFCAHAIHKPNEIFIVEDSRKDERFYDNPLVIGDPKVVFYAGIPLVSDNGLPLGTLCVIDHEPKVLNEKQLQSLTALSTQVMVLLRLRKKKIKLEKALSDLEEKNKSLEKFAQVAAHDLKSPLIGISSLTKLFSERYSDKIDANGKKMLGVIENASIKLQQLIEGLLENSRSEQLLKEKNSA